MKEYVSVDVETTGLAPKQDKIIEIGAVRVRDGQIVESFTSFVNPGRILPAHITELTGILQEQVDEAETMESVLPAFLGVCRRSAPCGTSDFVRLWIFEARGGEYAAGF